MTTVLVFAVILFTQSPQGNASAPSAEAQPMSLAERAAAARKAAAERDHSAASPRDTDGPPALTSEQRGAVRGTEYVNDVLHCKLDLANEWEQLSAERVARDEETARRFVNPDGRASPYRVLWIGDASGRNVAVSVLPVSPTMPSELSEVAARIKQISRVQLAKAENLVDEKEPILLGDAKHKFAAFRLKYSIRGIPIVQSGQVTRSNGFLMTLTVTGSSDQDVAEALQSLNSRLSWIEARP